MKEDKDKEKKAEENESQRVQADYADLLREVRDMKELTDTKAWQRLHRNIRAKISAHADAVLDAEKPREVVQHQEGVKILREVLAYPKAPVDLLTEFIKATPLFARMMPVRAEWNEALGKIELIES